MPSFHYRAQDETGQLHKGQLDAHSARLARDQLRKQGLLPIHMEEMAERQRQDRGVWFQRALAADHLALFLQQLATLLQSGLPLAQALDLLQKQAEHHRVRRFVSQIKTQVMEGYGLAQALRSCDYHIAEDVTATVTAGEESGHLVAVLTQLGDAVERSETSRKKLRSAMVYPLLMLMFSLLIVGFLLVGVLPKVVTVFNDMDQSLPPLTQNILALSDFLQQSWRWLLLGILLFLWGLMIVMRREKPRRVWQNLLLHTPWVKTAVIEVAVSQWSRTLSVLLSAGVPMVKALDISAQSTALLAFKDTIKQAAETVRQGGALSKSLESSPLIPLMVRYLMMTGEQSATLDKMLLKSSEQYEQKVQLRTASLLSLVEPVMILLLGGVVMTIVLAIMLPIFEMNQMMG